MDTDFQYQLEEAIATRDIKRIEILVSKGADLNLPNADGFPPIFAAVLVGDIAILEYLLRSGARADVFVEEPYSDMLASTPLALAQNLRLLGDFEVFAKVVILLEKW